MDREKLVEIIQREMGLQSQAELSASLFLFDQDPHDPEEVVPVSFDPEKLGEENFKKLLKEFKFRTKASTPSDDSMYLLAQNPLNHKWYLFEQSGYGPTPSTPVEIMDDYPEWFDGD